LAIVYEYYLLFPKSKLGLLLAMSEILCGNAFISLEGDLSQVAMAIRTIPGHTSLESSVLRRQTIEPLQDFFILPLEWNTIDQLQDTILKQVGVGSHLLHAQIAKNGCRQFGAYDLDDWGPGMQALCSVTSVVPEPTLKQLVSRKILRYYEGWTPTA
jgi:hypothetical protein